MPVAAGMLHKTQPGATKTKQVPFSAHLAPKQHDQTKYFKDHKPDNDNESDNVNESAPASQLQP